MITKIRLSSTELEKWLHQNHAVCVGDYVEGCLLDNFVVMTKRGHAAIYEQYLNSNSSGYYIEWEQGPAQEVYRNWYRFEESAEREG